MQKWSLKLARVAAAGVLSAGPLSFAVAQDVAPGDRAKLAVDTAARLNLADSILGAREEAAGRPLDLEYRVALRATLAGLPVGQLETIEKAGEVNLAELLPNAFGDPAADLVYTPVAPCRVFDTRSAVAGILVGGTQRNFLVAGSASLASQGGSASGCGVPLGPATSVIINFAAVTPTGPGNLRAWAVASPQPAAPTAAVMNFSAALPALANGVAVPICNVAATSCASDLRLQADVSSVHVVGDVVGYFARPVNTVTTVLGEDTTGAFDPSSQPVFCSTSDITPATNKRAVVRAKAAMLTTGAIGYALRPVVSTDGGATWSFGPASLAGRGGADGVEWAPGTLDDVFDLSAGTTYRFGVQFFRILGTATASDGRCQTLVELHPR